MNPGIVAGRYPVRRLSAETVERKIGKTALHVLRMLWAWRDPETGLVTVQRERLAASRGFARVSVPATMRALVRLAECGLVENLGWREVETAKGARIPVYTRRVYGADAPAKALGERHVLAVPEPVAAWISRRVADARRGGGRGRGGAPRGNRNRFGDGSKTAHARWCHSVEPILASVRAGRVRVDSEAARLEAEDRREQARKRAKGRAAGDNGSSRPPTMDRVALDPTSGSSDLPSLREGRAAASAAAIDPSLAASPLESNPEKSAPRVLRLGPATHDKRATVPIRGIPDYPRLRSATIPNPPLLAEDASDAEAAHALAKAYRGAFEAATGQPCWAARLPQVVKTKKTWALLLEAGAMLRDSAVPPAGWVAWSFTVWRSFGRSRKPPTLAWCFSTKRIGGDLKWYQHEGYDEIGGLIVSGPIEKNFARRYMAMRDAADRGLGGSAEALLAHFFPEGYAQALQATHKEAEQTRDALARRLADGDWLWGK